MEFLIYPKASESEKRACRERCDAGGKPVLEGADSFYESIAEGAYESILNGECVDFAKEYRASVPTAVLTKGRVVPESQAELEDAYDLVDETLRAWVEERNQDAREDPTVSRVRFCMKKGAGYKDLMKGVDVGGLSGLGRRRRSRRGSPSKGWSEAEPERASTRRKMPASCFLKRTGGQRKYPVCPRGAAKPSCRGIMAAFNRARQQGDTAVAKKALRLAKRTKCPWFKTGKKAQELARKWKI